MTCCLMTTCYPRYRYGQLVEINSHSLFSKWFSEVSIDDSVSLNCHPSRWKSVLCTRRERESGDMDCGWVCSHGKIEGFMVTQK